MRRILPINNNITFSTYQNYAFFQCIGLCYKGFENIMFNSFINTEWTDAQFKILNDYRNINLEWIEHPNGWLISIEDLIKQIKNDLNNNIYIGGMYDEYYIPGKTCYHNYHYWHDYYLYGFDDEEQCFYTVGYFDNMTYKNHKITYKDFALSVSPHENVLFQQQTTYSSYYIRITYKPNERCIDQLSIPEIYRNLYDYRFPKKPINMMEQCTGVYCYEALCKFLSDGYFDLRSHRTIMEHKQHMSNRLKFINMNSKIQISEELCKIYDLEIKNKSSVLFNIAIKYSLTADHSLIVKMIAEYEKMKKKEETILFEIMDELLRKESVLTHR